MSDHRVRLVRVGAVLAVVLLAGGCAGTTTPPDGAASSGSPTSLAPLLPAATSEADVAVDQQLAAALDREFASDDYAGLVSVIVLADGRTAYERYYDSVATDHHHVWSSTSPGSRPRSRSARWVSSMSPVTTCKPFTKPGSASLSPTPNAIEQADPGGVSWTKRSSASPHGRGRR